MLQDPKSNSLKLRSSVIVSRDDEVQTHLDTETYLSCDTFSVAHCFSLLHVDVILWPVISIGRKLAPANPKSTLRGWRLRGRHGLFLHLPILRCRGSLLTLYVSQVPSQRAEGQKVLAGWAWVTLRRKQILRVPWWRGFSLTQTRWNRFPIEKHSAQKGGWCWKDQ